MKNGTTPIGLTMPRRASRKLIATPARMHTPAVTTWSSMVKPEAASAFSREPLRLSADEVEYSLTTAVTVFWASSALASVCSAVLLGMRAATIARGNLSKGS